MRGHVGELASSALERSSASSEARCAVTSPNDITTGYGPESRGPLGSGTADTRSHSTDSSGRRSPSTSPVTGSPVRAATRAGRSSSVSTLPSGWIAVNGMSLPPVRRPPSSSRSALGLAEATVPSRPISTTPSSSASRIARCRRSLAITRARWRAAARRPTASAVAPSAPIPRWVNDSRIVPSHRTGVRQRSRKVASTACTTCGSCG